MKKHLLSLLMMTPFVLVGQNVKKTPEYKMSKNDAEAQMRFLASDQMLGRRTGSVTNRVAARYLAEEFRKLGLKPAQDQTDYLQAVAMDIMKPVRQGTIIGAGDTLSIGKGFVVFGGNDPTQITDKEVVFVGFGWKDDAKEHDDYKDVDVKDKIVVAQVGTPDSKSPNEMFSAATRKRRLLQEKGAAALIEIFSVTTPWNIVSNYFNGETMILADTKDKRLPHYWINPQAAKSFKKGTLKSMTIDVAARERTPVHTYNVVGVLEGSDPALRNEYVVLSAHYDHVGVGSEGGGSYSKSDSIFNGARDNAFGTVAVLQAAKALSVQKPKRSIVFIGYTGEEVGLLGSKYYAENPLVPLKDCIFNINCDGAGYNDTTKVTVVGLSRTDAQAEIEKAAIAFGLTATNDPAPEQNLFDRSDNVNFAAKGVPAPTFSPGFSKFDEKLFKYYHQVADNPETINMDYLVKYCQIYTYAARLIANRPTRPKWVAGDKYEKAFESLYK